MCNLREGFVIRREGFEEAPWRLREAFSKTRSAKASRSPLEGFAKASRRRHGRLHLETIRQIMTSPPKYRIQFLVFTGIDRTINNDFFCSIVGVRGYLLDHSGDEGNTAGLISREYYFLRGPSA